MSIRLCLLLNLGDVSLEMANRGSLAMRTIYLLLYLFTVLPILSSLNSKCESPFSKGAAAHRQGIDVSNPITDRAWLIKAHLYAVSSQGLP